MCAIWYTNLARMYSWQISSRAVVPPEGHTLHRTRTADIAEGLHPSTVPTSLAPHHVDHVASVDVGRRRAPGGRGKTKSLAAKGLERSFAPPSPAVDAHRIITTDDDNSDM